jgi:hypothetical protein
MPKIFLVIIFIVTNFYFSTISNIPVKTVIFKNNFVLIVPAPAPISQKTPIETAIFEDKFKLTISTSVQAAPKKPNDYPKSNFHKSKIIRVPEVGYNFT